MLIIVLSQATIGGGWLVLFGGTQKSLDFIIFHVIITNNAISSLSILFNHI